MGFREWLIACLNKVTLDNPAKAQRPKGREFFFPPLRRCGKTFVLVLLTCLSTIYAQSRHAMTASDILRIATVGDAQISPSGEWVVYTVSSIDGDVTRSSLWLVRASLEGRPPTRRPPSTPNPEFDQIRQPANRLLPAGWNASNPRWS